MKTAQGSGRVPSVLSPHLTPPLGPRQFLLQLCGALCPILCCLLQGGSRTLLGSPNASTDPTPAIRASPDDPTGQKTPLIMLRW